MEKKKRGLCRVLLVQVARIIKGRAVSGSEGQDLAKKGQQLDSWGWGVGVRIMGLWGFKLGRTSRLSLHFSEEEPGA